MQISQRKDMEKQEHAQKISRKTKLTLLQVLLCLICFILVAWSSCLTFLQLNSKKQVADLSLEFENVKSFANRLPDEFNGIQKNESTSDFSFLSTQNEASYSKNENDSNPVNFLQNLVIKRRRRNAPSHPERKTRSASPAFEAQQQNTNNKRVAIHVQAIKVPTRVPATRLPLIGWSVSNLMATPFGTKHLNSRLGGYVTVPQSGIYYLYSQVVVTRSPGRDFSSEIGVGRYGATTFTKCLFRVEAEQDTYATCRASGLRYMTKGEGISVTVKPRGTQVYMSPELTYFGAFLVGS